MGRISKRPKRPPNANPKLNDLVDQITDVPEDELAALLDGIRYWNWPRTDLHYWIKPLNRFDQILEDACRLYDIGSCAVPRLPHVRGERDRDASKDKVQQNEFTPRTKNVILSILRFTRLLLDNATNRKLYASFDRMNDLLLTRDLDVLESVLRLILRRAHQIASPGHTHSPEEVFNLTPDRIYDLTRGWKDIQLARVSMYDICKDRPDGQLMPVPASLDKFTFQYYRRVSSDEKKPSASNVEEGTLPSPANSRRPAIVATPSTQRATRPSTVGRQSTTSQPSTPSTAVPKTHADSSTEGMTEIALGPVASLGDEAIDVLATTIEKHDLPANQRLVLLQKLRIHMSLANPVKRKQLIRIRLLATSVLIHISAESAIENSLFLYQPDFVAQLAELVQPDSLVDISIRTAAITTLDTVSRIRSRVGEVATLLNVGVNHGSMLSILRQLLDDLRTTRVTSTQTNAEDCDSLEAQRIDYIDAVFNFLMHLQSTGFAGNMLLTAGVVPMLVDFVRPTQQSSPDSLLAAHRAVTFLDNFTYSFSNAGNPFSTAGGVAVFVDRVTQLVKRGLADTTASEAKSLPPSSTESDKQLGFLETTLLKSLFRCLQRLMGSGATSDGVRTLIDSSLVPSCRDVMLNKQLFGPQNYALAINIMLTFVHNEPTSLSIIQEAKLSDAFYDSVLSQPIEPSLDVLTAIPTAIGALCLNEAGLNGFISSRLSLFTQYFECFLSPVHARVLFEREHAAVVGSHFDELMRHHPALKESVFAAIMHLLQGLFDKGQQYQPEHPEEYILVLAPEEKSDAIMEVSEAGEPAAGDAADSTAAAAPTAASTRGSDLPARHSQVREENDMLISIAVTARFLEGFLCTPSHCKDFVKQDGLKAMFRLFTLSCIPWNSAVHNPYPGLTTVFLTINEHASAPLFKAFVEQFKDALDCTTEFWAEVPEDQTPHNEKVLTTLKAMLSPKDKDELGKINALFRNLVRTEMLLGIAGELWSADGYISRQNTTQLVSMLKGAAELKMMQDLCAMQRACVLAHVALKDMHRITDWKKVDSAIVSSDSHVGHDMMHTDESLASMTASEPVETAANTESVAGGSTTQTHSAAEQAPAETHFKLPKPLSPSKNSLAMRHTLSSISESSKAFIKGVMSLQIGRRTTIDSGLRKDATFVAHSIASGIRASLAWPDGDSKIALDYCTVMVKFLTDLILADRSTSAGLQLLFLKALDKQDGIVHLMDIFDRLQAIIREHDAAQKPATSDDDNMRFIHAIGGMKLLLNAFDALVSQKILLHPAYTTLINPDKNSPSHFEPQTFLVKLRSRILPPITALYDSIAMRELPPMLVRAVFRILLRILEGQGESVTNSTSLTGIDPAPGPLRPQVVAPSQVHVQTLIDMGFPRSSCETALIRRHNDIHAATEYLITHPEMVNAAREAESIAAAATAVDDALRAVASVQPAPEGGDSIAAIPPVNSSDMVTESTASLGVTLTAGDAVASASESGLAGPSDVNMASASNQSTIAPVTEAAAVPQLGDMAIETDAQGSSVVDGGKIAPRTVLEEERKALQQRFLGRALDLCSYHGELVFDVKDALKAVEFGFGSTFEAGLDDAGGIVRDTLNYIGEHGIESEATERGLAARVRLLALLHSDTAFSANIDKHTRQVMQIVETLLDAFGKQQLEKLRFPKWISSALLLGELIIARADQPSMTRDLDSASDSVDTDSPGRTSVLRGPALTSARSLLFDTAMSITSKQCSELDVLQSATRLILLLTRSPDYAQAFVDRNGLSNFLRMLSDQHPPQNALQQMVIMIVRHTYEDKGMLLAFLKRGMELWFGRKRRPNDIGMFTRELSSLACRDVDLFMQAASTQCQLVESPSGALEVRKREAPSSALGVSEAAEQGDLAAPSSESQGMDVESAATVTATKQTRDPVAALLDAMAALVTRTTTAAQSSTSAVGDLPLADTQATTASLAANAAPAGAASRDNRTDDSAVKKQGAYFAQCSFYANCLGELLSAYPPSKPQFLQWKPSTSDNTAMTFEGSLDFVLQHMIPTESLVPSTTIESRIKFGLSSLGIGLILCLCRETSANGTSTQPPAVDLNEMRSSILDAVASAMRDALKHSDSMNSRYGRLAALAHLCSQLLSPTQPGMATSRPSADMSMHIARLMLQKNFPNLFCTTLATIDLNFPSVQNLLNALLTPLELLSRLAKAFDRSSTSSLPTGGERTDAPAESETHTFAQVHEAEVIDGSPSESGSDDEMHHDENEDGQDDVFRNSALGIYEGELEPADQDDQYMSEDNVVADNEDDWGEEDDDMMEDEGVVPSDVSDESEIDGDDVDMVGEMREALETVQETMDPSSEDDQDDGDRSSSHGSSHDESDHDDQDDIIEAGPGLTADLADAIRQGRLQPVDDVTEQIINDEMEMMGEGADGVQAIWRRQDDDDDGGLSDNDEIGQGFVEVDDQDDDLDDGAAGDVVGNLMQQLGRFDGGTVEIAIDDGAPGAEHPILSVELGPGHSLPGSSRRAPRPANSIAIGQHSLLQDPSEPSRGRNSRSATQGSSRHRARAGRGNEYIDWLHSVEDMMGTGAGQLLEQIFGNAQPHDVRGLQGGQIETRLRADIPLPPMRVPASQVTTLLGSRGLGGFARAPVPTAGGDDAASLNALLANPTISICTTSDRWNEEAATFNGGVSAAERLSTIARHLTRILLPTRIQKETPSTSTPAPTTQAVVRDEVEGLMAASGASSAGAEPADPPQPAANAAVTDSDMPVASTAPTELPQISIATPAPATPVAPVAVPFAASAAPAGGDTPSTSSRPSWRERVEQRRSNRPAQGASASAAIANQSESRDAGAEQSDATQPAAQSAATADIGGAATARALAVQLAAVPQQSEDVSAAGEPQPTGTPAETTGTDSAQDLVMETAQSTNDNPSAEAGPSNAVAVPRVTIQIHGNTVDITETGIDPTFLEALPDDMREEVLNQHFRDARGATAAAVLPEAPSTIDAEFLNALPPELRAEVMAQEALEQARRLRQQQSAAAPATGGGAATDAAGAAAEIDPATFLASLDPHLRRAVLLEQDEEMLNSLPADLQAEYEMLRHRSVRQYNQAHGLRRQLAHRGVVAQTDLLGNRLPKGAEVLRKDGMQLVDKSALVVLVRLLFFPPPLKKNVVQNILGHVCDNSRSRADVVDILLSMLYAGTPDNGQGGLAVDNLLISVGAGTPTPPKSAGKHKTPSRSHAGTRTVNMTALPSLFAAGGPSNNIPNLVVQRTLDTLTHLSTVNQTTADFFLSVQKLSTLDSVRTAESSASRAKTTSKKDKGKARATVDTSASQNEKPDYPISVLFALLHRTTLTQTPSIMEALTRLLAHITVSLRHPAKASASATPATSQALPAPMPAATQSGEPPAPATEDAATSPSTPAPATTSVPSDGKSSQPREEAAKMPSFTAESLRSVARVLDLDECSSRMFSALLSLIHNLWHSSDARRTLSTELIRMAQHYGGDLLGELEELESAITVPSTSASDGMALDDDAVASTAGRSGVRLAVLSKFSAASSKQAKLLRVLKALEHARAQQAKAANRRPAQSAPRAVAGNGATQVPQAPQTAAAEAAVAGPIPAPEEEEASAIASAQELVATAPAVAEIPSDSQKDASPSTGDATIKIDELYSGFDFSPVWTKLSDCLTIMEQDEATSNAATLLPLVETFLLMSSWSLQETTDDDDAVVAANTPPAVTIASNDADMLLVI